MTLMMCAQNEICDAANAECDQCVAPEAQCIDPEILRSCSPQGHWEDLDCTTQAQVCDETLPLPICVDPPLP
jgi:hypothetical protein